MVTWGNHNVGWLLLLVPACSVLLFFVLQWKKQKQEALGDPRLVQELLRDYLPRRFRFKQIALITVIALLVVAWMDPRTPDITPIPGKSRGVDMMLVLDLSKSMLATDEAPSRLDRAKLFIQQLLDRFPGERVGLVVFAGHAYLQMPSTTDHAAARLFLASAQPDLIPTQGTVISEALQLASSSFPQQQRKNRTVVLISDGEDHDSDAESAAAQLAREGMIVHAIAVGSANGTTLMDPVSGLPKKDTEGNPVFTKMNPDALRAVAEAGTGKFFVLQAGMDAALDGLSRALRQYAVSLDVPESEQNHRHYFPWILMVGFILLAFALFLPERRRIRPIAALVLVFLFGNAFAQESAPRFLYEGNQAFQQGKYDEATKAYERAHALKPSSHALFNMGHAAYKNGKKEAATESFGKSATLPGSKQEQSEAWYNQGVVFQENNQLDECIEAYKKALRVNPADEDARFNLQRALEKKRQQQKQPENKPNDDPKKNKDKNKPQPKEPEPKQNPAPKPSQMSKQQAEQQLKALQRQEKQLQDKQKKQVGGNPQKPEKDW
jgi:Ca-activated chloride channel family protein